MFTKDNFKCNRYCGKCCINIIVRVTRKEINRIRRLGYEESDFIERDLFDKNRWVLRKKEGEHCVFLKKAKGGMFSCSIYKNRPKICQRYPFFKDKPIKSCYPENLYLNAFFSFKEGKFIAK